MNASSKYIVFRRICVAAAIVIAVVVLICCYLIRCEGYTDFSLFGYRIHAVDSDDTTVISKGSLVFIKLDAKYSDGTQVEYVRSNKGFISSARAVKGRINGVCVAQLENFGAVLSFLSFTPIIGTLMLFLFTLLCVIIAQICADDNKIQKHNRFRMGIQWLFTVATNSYLVGFVNGTIYKGKLKSICVPGLNCYSCPGAYGACPLGSVQSMLAKRDGFFSIPFYVIGIIFIFGITLGRFICGYLCPFGLFQDLIYKIPAPKKLKIRTFKADSYLRYLKYILLVVFVILLPLITAQAFPWFCKLICPSGMLLGGIPLMTANASIRAASGTFTVIKLIILALVIITSVIIFRPFCKYICPLGAIYGLFNGISIYHYEVDKSKCTNCNACTRSCDMGVDITKNINSAECIRCGKCTKVCHTNAINKKFSFINKNK